MNYLWDISSPQRYSKRELDDLVGSLSHKKLVYIVKQIQSRLFTLKKQRKARVTPGDSRVEESSPSSSEQVDSLSEIQAKNKKKKKRRPRKRKPKTIGSTLSGGAIFVNKSKIFADYVGTAARIQREAIQSEEGSQIEPPPPPMPPIFQENLVDVRKLMENCGYSDNKISSIPEDKVAELDENPFQPPLHCPSNVGDNAFRNMSRVHGLDSYVKDVFYENALLLGGATVIAAAWTYASR